MALPTPVLSDGDIVEVQGRSDTSARLTWNIWSQDPIKAVILQVILSWQANVPYDPSAFHWTVPMALGQNRVCPLHYSF